MNLLQYTEFVPKFHAAHSEHPLRTSILHHMERGGIWGSPYVLPLMLQGFCGICYQVCNVPTTVTIPFQLSGITAAAAAASELGCTTDWIQIPCATDQQSSLAVQSTATVACINKICGAAFRTLTATPATPAPVYSKCLFFLNLASGVGLQYYR